VILISRFLSYLFHPIFAPLLSVYILFQLPDLENYKLNDAYKYFVYVTFFVNLVIAPLLLSLYFKKTGVIKSLEMNSVKERRSLYAITFIFYAFTAALLHFIQFPRVFMMVFLGACAVVAALYFLSILNQKISAHLSGLGGICGMLFILQLYFFIEISSLFLFFIVLSGIVASARFALGAHSFKELFLGFCLGFFAPCIVFAFVL
jgi:hypothetical protein